MFFNLLPTSPRELEGSHWAAAWYLVTGWDKSLTIWESVWRLCVKWYPAEWAPLSFWFAASLLEPFSCRSLSLQISIPPHCLSFPCMFSSSPSLLCVSLKESLAVLCRLWVPYRLHLELLLCHAVYIISKISENWTLNKLFGGFVV